MITLKLVIYLTIGTMIMLIPVIMQASWRGIKWQKAVAFTFSLTIVGTIGAYLMYYIENGWIGGTSFFGAVFIVPVVYVALSKVFAVSTNDMLDLCAPAVCAMLAVMKTQCLISGCCGGRILFLMQDGREFKFPSQIVEMIVAVALVVVLLMLAKNNKCNGEIYPCFLIIYGTLRFVLNVFRDVWSNLDMFLPFGNIWSMVAVVCGGIWLVVRRMKKGKLVKEC